MDISPAKPFAGKDCPQFANPDIIYHFFRVVKYFYLIFPYEKILLKNSLQCGILTVGEIVYGGNTYE